MTFFIVNTGKSTLPPWTPYPVSSTFDLFPAKVQLETGGSFPLAALCMSSTGENGESLNEHHPANLPCHSSVSSETHAYVFAAPALMDNRAGPR